MATTRRGKVFETGQGANEGSVDVRNGGAQLSRRPPPHVGSTCAVVRKLISLGEKNRRRHPSVPTPLLPLPVLNVWSTPPSSWKPYVRLSGRDWNAAQFVEGVCDVPDKVLSYASDFISKSALTVNTHIHLDLRSLI